MTTERLRVTVHRVQNGTLQRELVSRPRAIVLILRDEQFPEKLLRSGYRRDAGAAARPAHHAPAVQAVFGTNRQRWKPRNAPDRFRGTLVEADVSLGHSLCIH